MGFKMPNKSVLIILALASISFIFVIVSWSTYWFGVHQDDAAATRDDHYFFTRMTSTYKLWGQSVTNSIDYKDYPGEMKHTRAILDTCLAFLTIGGIVLVAFIVVFALNNFLLKNNALLKLISLIAIFACIVLFAISFFTFTGFGRAVGQDFGTCDFGPCEKLIGKEGESPYTTNWGPGPGWWILIPTLILTSFTAVIVFKTRAQE